MATYKHIRSNVDSKRPTTSLADGQIAINTNVASPGLFFKDSAGTALVKVGPVHVGTTAPNATPATGGSTGNSTGEQWLDTSLTPAQLKVWNGSAWVGVVADELPVSKLQNGSAYQLIQTDAAGTGVEWTDNIDVPGTLAVTSTATFDSTASFASTATFSSIASHPLGTAAAPTITFTGDTDTGVYSPGVNQVALSTAGTGRLFVAANGNIGVATATPATALDVNGDLTVTDKIIHSGDTNTSIRFPAADTFAVETGNVERLRVDSSGRVGIGTISPDSPLQVIGASSAHFKRLDNGTSSILITGNTKQWSIGVHSDDYFRITREGVGERLRITSTGQLSHIGGGSSVSPAVGFNGSAPSNSLVIDSSGNVGIGTSSPSAKLDVNGNAEIAGAITTESYPSGNGASLSDVLNVRKDQGASDAIAVYSGGTAVGDRTVRITAAGSATLAGNITNGEYETGTNSYGCKLAAGGVVQVQRPSSNANSNVFESYLGTSTTPTISFTANGSATFAGSVGIGGTLPASPNISLSAGGTGTFGGNPYQGASTGVSVIGTGTVRASAVTGTPLWQGYLNGTTTATSQITSQGSATFASSVTAQSYVTSSDQRFKENITDANSQLADVTALGNSLRNWDWTADAPVADKDTRFLGLVAQEAETISPGIVATIARTKQGAELTPEVVVPAVYETRTVPAVLDEEGEVVEAETTEEVLVTEEQVTPATYEQLDDSYKGIKNDVLVMKLLGAVAELSAKVAALEAS